MGGRRAGACGAARRRTPERPARLRCSPIRPLAWRLRFVQQSGNCVKTGMGRLNGFTKGAGDAWPGLLRRFNAVPRAASMRPPHPLDLQSYTHLCERARKSSCNSCVAQIWFCGAARFVSPAYALLGRFLPRLEGRRKAASFFVGERRTQLDGTNVVIASEAWRSRGRRSPTIPWIVTSLCLSR